VKAIDKATQDYRQSNTPSK